MSIASRAFRPDKARVVQAIVRAIAQACVDLGIDLVVEGVETLEEFSWFNDLGVNLYQGYLFAKPMFEAMPAFVIPDLA